MKKNNLTLIGMPGVGKSTIGVLLAKKLGFGFLDSDLLIQERYGKLLLELISARGLDGFLQLENEVNASIDVSRYIIATGGSAVYGKEAMEHFSETSRVLYLSASYEEIKERLLDLQERGVVLKKGQTLKELYKERVPLYEQYADYTVDCNGKSIREIVEKIQGWYKV